MTSLPGLANAATAGNTFTYKKSIPGVKLGSNNTNPTQPTEAFTLSGASLDFGQVTAQASTTTKSFRFTNTGTSSVSVTYTVNSAFTVNNDCLGQIAPNQFCTFVVSPNFSLGAKLGTITVSAAGVSKTVSTSFEGISTEKVDTNVNSLDFGTLQEGQSSSKSILVVNTGETIFSPQITASAGFSVSSSCYTIYPQNSCWATVTALGSLTNATGTLTVTGGTSTKLISLNSTVNPTVAAIDVSVEALDFGSLIQGQSSSKSFVLRNTGNTMYAPQITVTTGYSVASGCYNLYPQDSCWVTVTALGNVATPNGTFTVTAGPVVKSVPLTSSVAALVDAVDASVVVLDFGNLTEGQAVQGKSFMVMNIGNTMYAPQITVTPGFSAVSACYNLYPQNSCWVTVTSAASVSNPSGTLTITAGSATKTVSLTSTVTAIADKIDTSVDNVDFGTIMANSNVQGKSFMVMNTGNTVYTPQFSVTPGFTFEHSCFNVYPQNTCWVTVHTLASYSNPNGTLTIKGGLATKSVSLTATVTPYIPPEV